MVFDDVEKEIRSYLAAFRGGKLASALLDPVQPDRLYIIKYTAAKFLNDILKTGCLFASSTPGYTWGDAVYVSPLSHPRSTMMYGAVGVVGWVDVSRWTIFDATDPSGIQLYQHWISFMPDLFNQLTTTIHSNQANQQLRNRFRSRFAIDCVCFRPDEICADYVDEKKDVWLALSHWNAAGQIASGPSNVVKDLKWCAVTPESFERHGLGYTAVLYPVASSNHTFEPGTYSSLFTDLKNAYVMTGKKVIIPGF